MPLPILLPLIGLGLGAKFGMDWLAGEREEERAETMLGALRSARTAVPGSEVGETGPELPEMRTDWGMVGEKLLEAGDPAGLSLAMSAGMASSEAEAEARESELAHRRRMEEIRLKEGEAYRRQTRELAAKRAKEARALAAGFAPQYHVPGSAEHFEIMDQGQSLKFASGILRDFQSAMSEYGTETWGQRAGELAAKREMLMLFLKEGEQTGAIDAGTVALFDSMLPDVTALSGDPLNIEAGKLNGLIDLFNSKYISSYQARSMYTTDVPVVGMIPAMDMLPSGFDWVDAGAVERHREAQEGLAREAAQRQAEENVGGLRRLRQERRERPLYQR